MKHIWLPAETPRWYSNYKNAAWLWASFRNAFPPMNTLCHLETSLWSSTTYSYEPLNILAWLIQTTREAEDIIYISDWYPLQKSITVVPQTNKIGGTKKTREQQVGVGIWKSQTQFQLLLLQDLWHAGHYLSTLTCFLSRIQKWNIMSDKQSHYSSAWNRRTTFIRHVMTTNCCTESMWHDAHFLVSCMADLIVSAENSLGVSWLEILAGESLQSSDNLYIPFQRSLFEILLQRQREQKASDFPKV